MVTVYTTSTCPWCTKLKHYLKENGIDFTEVNVGSDKSAAMEMVRKSGQMGVPVLDIDGNIVIGFEKAEIDRLLKLN